MAYELRDNSGTLFTNKKKTTESHPTMRGEIMVDGHVYFISAWSKYSDKAGKWLSLSVQPKDDQPQRQQGGAGEPKGFSPDLPHQDDLPF